MRTTLPSPHLSSVAGGDEEAQRRGMRAQARAIPAEAAFICDTLRLADLCRRFACRRTGRCRGHPRMCLDARGDTVPLEAYAFAVLLAQARREGEPAREIEASYPDEALAHRCWVAALDARVTRRR